MRTAGSTSFATVTFDELKHEVEHNGLDPNAIVIGKTYWREHKIAQIDKKIVPYVAAPKGEAAASEVLKEQGAGVEMTIEE